MEDNSLYGYWVDWFADDHENVHYSGTAHVHADNEENAMIKTKIRVSETTKFYFSQVYILEVRKGL